MSPVHFGLSQGLAWLEAIYLLYYSNMVKPSLSTLIYLRFPY